MMSPWILPDDLRGELKKPLGRIYTDFPAWTGDTDLLIGVGDIVSKTLIDAGFSPDITIIDGKTRRKEINNPAVLGDMSQTVTVENPPAHITDELWSAVASSIKEVAGGDKHINIMVIGEEDLAALACISIAPDGSHVIYGQPDEGAVIVRVEQEIRDKVNRLLKKMEV